MNTMKWLLKREFWEHKGGFFWAPVVVSVLLALLTIGSMLFISVSDGRGFHFDGNNSAVNLQQALNAITDPQKIEFARGLAVGYPAVAMPLMFTLAVPPAKTRSRADMEPPEVSFRRAARGSSSAPARA